LPSPEAHCTGTAHTERLLGAYLLVGFLRARTDPNLPKNGSTKRYGR
jgi:hypothetical protein